VKESRTPPRLKQFDGELGLLQSRAKPLRQRPRFEADPGEPEPSEENQAIRAAGSLKTLPSRKILPLRSSRQTLNSSGLVTSAAGLPSLTYSRTIRDDQNQLLRLSLSARNHPAGDLALRPVYPELSRRRRFVGGTRDHGLLRNCSALGEPFWAVSRSGPAQTTLPAPDAETLDVVVRRDTVGAVAAGAAADVWISAALGLSCKLVYLADTTGRKINPAFATAGQTVNFPDGFPVLLGSLASLADLNTRLAVPIPIGRFGPNIVVSGAAPWAEDCWRRIRIRDVLRSDSLLTASCGPSKQTCD
jgi:hypothetical protein